MAFQAAFYATHHKPIGLGKGITHNAYIKLYQPQSTSTGEQS